MRKVVSQVHRNLAGWYFLMAYLLGPITVHPQKYGLYMECSQSAIFPIQNWLSSLEQARAKSLKNRVVGFLRHFIV